MPEAFNWEDVDQAIEVAGIHDGWCIALLKDGTYINRFAGEGSEREAAVDAYLRGEESNGRWL